MLFCHDCHINDTRIIPGKAIKENDYLYYTVAKVSAEFIDSQSLLPLLTVGAEIFPTSSSNIGRIHKMRICLHKIRDMPLCTTHMRSQFNIDTTTLLPAHIMNNINTYSLRDMMDINIPPSPVDNNNHKLASMMSNIINKYVTHIWSCNNCINNNSGICIICNSLIPIFPFNIHHYYKCSYCNTIYHKQCINRSNNICPKCYNNI